MAREATLRHSAAVHIGGREVPCRLLWSKTATRLRIRVKREELEVVLPVGRDAEEGLAFVRSHEAWVVEQLDRARRMVALRRPERWPRGHVLLLGQLIPVQVKQLAQWRAPPKVAKEDDRITVTCGTSPRTPPHRSLENWMRRQARVAIERHLENLSRRLRRTPSAVYVMGQRTKWGNCSALGNLSFNWRLIMAPEFVLRYIVTHEMVHLAVPDHSPKFWLTVRSHCPETERARQWLVANGGKLTADVRDLLPTIML